MIDISCEMCMDLIPLVRDGIASDDSRMAVVYHTQNCPDCRQLFDEEVPPVSDSKLVLEKIHRKVQLFSAMVLMFGIFFGLSLTASSDLFYNALIMPLIGMIGYYIFRWKALYELPCLLFITHLITNTFGLIRGAQHLDFWSLILCTGIYCVFSLIGIVIAALLHFAFRKES